MAEPKYLETVDVSRPARGLRLLSRLSTTLEPAEVLRSYFLELREWIGVSGLAWRGGDLLFRWGRAGRYRYDYGLSMDGEALGELSVHSRRRLDGYAVMALEESTGLLIHPLRNALRYREAVMAVRRDPLTGLGNRTELEESLGRELEFSRRHGTPFSLAILDVDNFKLINDRYGHSSGDTALKEVARLMRAEARAGDLLFRFAGDEFVIAMRHTGQEGALAVAERMRRAVTESEFGVPLRITVGVATALPEEDAESLFRRADAALLAAKRAGRNRVGS